MFSLDDPKSLQHVRSKWAIEVRHYVPDVFLYFFFSPPFLFSPLLSSLLFSLLSSLLSPLSFNSLLFPPPSLSLLIQAGILLVGSKADLRKKGQAQTTQEQGEEAAIDIEAFDYVECSAKTGQGIEVLFLSLSFFLSFSLSLFLFFFCSLSVLSESYHAFCKTI